MPSETSVLFHNLHQVLRRLSDAQQALAEGPHRIALAEKQIAAAEAAIEAQKNQIRDQKKAVDQLNLQLKTREAELKKLQGVLNQATSNKEYDIVKGQIAAANAAKDELEDGTLQGLEEIDVSKQKLQDLERQLQSKREELKAITAQAKEEEPGLTAAVEQCESELAEIEKHMPSGESRVVLKRLRSAHGAGACSELDSDNFCTACSNKVTTQDGVRINMGDFICCRACGRILYSC